MKGPDWSNWKFLIGGLNALIKSLDELGGRGTELTRCFAPLHLKYESRYYPNANCDTSMTENVPKEIYSWFINVCFSLTLLKYFTAMFSCEPIYSSRSIQHSNITYMLENSKIKIKSVIFMVDGTGWIGEKKGKFPLTKSDFVFAIHGICIGQMERYRCQLHTCIYAVILQRPKC